MHFVGCLRIQHFLRINHILNDIKTGIVYSALAAMAFMVRYGNQFLRFLFLYLFEAFLRLSILR